MVICRERTFSEVRAGFVWGSTEILNPRRFCLGHPNDQCAPRFFDPFASICKSQGPRISPDWWLSHQKLAPTRWTYMKIRIIPFLSFSPVEAVWSASLSSLRIVIVCNSHSDGKKAHLKPPAKWPNITNFCCLWPLPLHKNSGTPRSLSSVCSARAHRTRRSLWMDCCRRKSRVNHSVYHAWSMKHRVSCAMFPLIQGS